MRGPIKEYYCTKFEENSPKRAIREIKDRTPEIRGTYVDLRLINYIAIWSSAFCAILVEKIMNALNENSQLTRRSIDQWLKTMKEMNAKLRDQNRIIQEQTQELKEQWETTRDDLESAQAEIKE